MNEKLLAYLKERGLLNERQVEDLRKEYRETKKSVREIILEKGLINEEVLIEALSAVSRIPTVKLYENQAPIEVRGLIKPELLRTHVMIPFGFDPEDNSTLLVALNDPMNMRGRDLAAISSKCHIKPYLATTSDILVTIDRYYGTEEIREAAELYTTTAEEDTSLESQIMQEDINSSPVVMLVNTMIEQAVRQRASDIHVEAEQDRVRVRYRVDGVLYTTATYSPKLLQAIIARLKIISGMDISEKRKPQDGRFSITVDRRDYDVRVSMLPTVYGEKCVMRLAQKKVLQRSKEELGFSKDELAKFNKILDKPNGIVL
ncbi:MAG: Flp pilus assembly complex ATPase component TadA, partial [Firmicutes bacterium]|nr:Flp pilus assembly complex ATPase component TadA [Bacillota bacterium]